MEMKCNKMFYRLSIQRQRITGKWVFKSTATYIETLKPLRL